MTPEMSGHYTRPPGRLGRPRENRPAAEASMDRLSKRGSVHGEGCLEKARVEVSEGIAGIGMGIKDWVR